MKKKIMAAIMAATMSVSAVGGLSAGAFDEWSYSEDLTVYVNGTEIDSGEYKPIIVNDRTLVRIVPIFDALGFEHSELDEYKSVEFREKEANATYTFVAEKNFVIRGTGFDKEAAINEKDTSSNIYFDVPATLQYFDVFYVPIRAFCDVTGMNIEWDASTRSVYITSKGSEVAPETNVDTNNEPIADAPVTSNGNELGYEFCCEGRIVGTSTVLERAAGTLDYDTLLSKSEEYIKSAPGYKTANGLEPQAALDLIKVAYDKAVSGTVYIYSDYIEVHTEYIAHAENELNYFRIIYQPNGLNNEGGEPCYLVNASVDNSFKDTNSTSRTVDMNYNVIGGAN